jgi:hypothetical protein
MVPIDPTTSLDNSTTLLAHHIETGSATTTIVLSCLYTQQPELFCRLGGDFDAEQLGYLENRASCIQIHGTRPATKLRNLAMAFIKAKQVNRIFHMAPSTKTLYTQFLTKDKVPCTLSSRGYHLSHHPSINQPNATPTNSINTHS